MTCLYPGTPRCLTVFFWFLDIILTCALKYIRHPLDSHADLARLAPPHSDVVQAFILSRPRTSRTENCRWKQKLCVCSFNPLPVYITEPLGQKTVCYFVECVEEILMGSLSKERYLAVIYFCNYYCYAVLRIILTFESPSSLSMELTSRIQVSSS